MTGGKRPNAGRPPGVPNKSTAGMRDFLQSFIEHNAETMQADFDKLEAVDKFRVLEKLWPYLLPKVEPETLSFQTELPPINIIMPKLD